MHSSIIELGIARIKREEIEIKDIIEVGSQDVNGSLKDHILTLNPKSYIGIDIEKGKNVDIICDAENLINIFGKESFDAVICTSTLEHVINWRKIVSNIKNICKPNGIMFIAVPSPGFASHEYPVDFWRFTLDDIKVIFSDCEIQALEKDKVSGLVSKIKKPENFIEKDLSNYKIFKIINSVITEHPDHPGKHLIVDILHCRDDLIVQVTAQEDG